MTNTNTRFHADGTCTYWDVLRQQWRTADQADVPDEILATLPQHERELLLSARAVASNEITAEQHGADDANARLDDASISTQDFDAAKAAHSMLRPGSHEADEALINALGWSGVYELAGLEYDKESAPSAEALAWCKRYNAGFRARLVEIVSEAQS